MTSKIDCPDSVIGPQSRRLITWGDLVRMVLLTSLALVSWIVPERLWSQIAWGLAYPAVRARFPGTCSNIGRIESILGDRQIPGTPRLVRTLGISNRIEDYLHTLREYRPGGWRPTIELLGKENIETALEEGHGLILWVSDFVYSSLVTKMGLHQTGFNVSHLSRPQHGFSLTRFGIRFLNPIRTWIEDRYLAERVVITGDGVKRAMLVLDQKLRDNGIVSITVGDQARKTIQVPCLQGYISLAAGPAILALRTGATLLPIFTVRTASGAFQVNIGRPLEVGTKPDRHESLETSLQQYVEILEPYLLKYPGQWRGWGLTRL